jgi:hypothetical protein
VDWKLAAGQWNTFRHEVRARWAAFSSSDLDQIAGERDRLCTALGTLYGLTPHDAEESVRGFEIRNTVLREVSSR